MYFGKMYAPVRRVESSAAAVRYFTYNPMRRADRGMAASSFHCFFCKEYLNDWDVQRGDGTCWRCRKIYYPRVEVRQYRV